MKELLLVLFVFCCLTACKQKTESERAATAPLFDDLGNYHHAVSTNSRRAQRYFDQGLTLTYAFNHMEAIRSFKEAARLDPSCAMFYWGAALAYGPNINRRMDTKDENDAFLAIQKALELSSKAAESERAYIKALSRRYSNDAGSDRRALDTIYAKAMLELTEHFPEDPDAATLFAESLMVLNRWDYWTEQGNPKPDTKKMMTVLERVLERVPEHPGANHYYIHVVEASPSPERGLPHAQRLETLVPGAGHLVHMPAHIYMRLGKYHEASKANERAAAADEKYIAQCNAQGFYPATYYPHNIHFLWASATMEGRSQVAIDAASKLVENIPGKRFLKYPFLEEFMPIKLLALAKFGRWEEILKEPQPDPEFQYGTAVWHYSRTLALITQNRIKEAEKEHANLLEITQSKKIESLNLYSGFSAAALLRIASSILAAEIAGAQGRSDEKITHLENATRMHDALPYAEPPLLYFPARQFLGAELLAQGRAAEAETVYREDLKQYPRNGWSLYGLEKCLRAQNSIEFEKVHAQFKEAWSRADVTLASSRF